MGDLRSHCQQITLKHVQFLLILLRQQILPISVKLKIEDIIVYGILLDWKNLWSEVTMEPEGGHLSLAFLDEILSSGKKWIVRNENLSHVRSCFSSLPTADKVPDDVREKVFVSLASCLEFEPNLWRFANHFLVPSFPPFKRFISERESEFEPPPVKRNKSGVDRKLFRLCSTP